jgi:hypothetical protein
MAELMSVRCLAPRSDAAEALSQGARCRGTRFCRAAETRGSSVLQRGQVLDIATLLCPLSRSRCKVLWFCRQRGLVRELGGSAAGRKRAVATGAACGAGRCASRVVPAAALALHGSSARLHWPLARHWWAAHDAAHGCGGARLCLHACRGPHSPAGRTRSTAA